MVGGITKPFRTVCSVVGARTPMLSTVGRLIVTVFLLANVAAAPASVWCLSRSQFAAHFDFAFEREGSYKIVV